MDFYPGGRNLDFFLGVEVHPIGVYLDEYLIFSLGVLLKCAADGFFSHCFYQGDPNLDLGPWS